MRSTENHLARARERLNGFHEHLDKLEAALQSLRKQAVDAEARFAAATREYVEAKTADTIAKLNSKE